MIAQHIKTGQSAEKQARVYLQKKRFKLLEKNYRCPFGEIDLIMKKKNLIVFVEVRCRNNLHFGTPLESVDINKQNKIIATAKYYLIKKSLYEKVDCRFDIIAIKHRQLTWYPNSFHEH